MVPRFLFLTVINIQQWIGVASTGQTLGILVVVIMVMDLVIDTDGDTLITIISMIHGIMLVSIILIIDHITDQIITDQIIVLTTDQTTVQTTNQIMVRIMQKRRVELVKMIVAI